MVAIVPLSLPHNDTHSIHRKFITGERHTHTSKLDPIIATHYTASYIDLAEQQDLNREGEGGGSICNIEQIGLIGYFARGETLQAVQTM